jgi:hypothetical protein
MTLVFNDVEGISPANTFEAGLVIARLPLRLSLPSRVAVASRSRATSATTPGSGPDGTYVIRCRRS